jgi:beta-lactam-binding protein with PASTA domain
MKWLVILCGALLAGCVTVELPKNLVQDTVKVGKDAYKAVVGEKPKPAAPEPAGSSVALAHSYVGKESQTIGEVKQRCVEEAAQKLEQVAGKQVSYSVTQNDVLTINATVVANCRLVADNP